MASSLTRSAHNATNSLHSLIYFAPETEHYLTGVGLRGNRMCYFAGRAAPMGAVGPGVVTATFYNFNPRWSPSPSPPPGSWPPRRPSSTPATSPSTPR